MSGSYAAHLHNQLEASRKAQASDEQKLADIYELVVCNLGRQASEIGDLSREIARVIFNGELSPRPRDTIRCDCTDDRHH